MINEPLDRWRAPFTAVQAVALNEYQTLGMSHPYTCKHSSAHPLLIAYAEGGWQCRDRNCEYEQGWAHALPLTIRHHLIAADLVSSQIIGGDGCYSISMHSREYAADLALQAIEDAGYKLVARDAD